MARDFIQLLTLALLVAVLPANADVRVEHTPDDPFGDGSIYIEGVIKAGDANRLRSVLEDLEGLESFDSNLWYVTLSSPGGDLSEAMQMGTMLRRTEYSLSVREGNSCSSSCAFVLMGGNRRNVFGSVGIHRPYFAKTMRDDAIDEAYRNTLAVVGEYLAEMNIPAGLADLMFSIPPNENRELSTKEVEMYFPAEDPVAEARRINSVAARIGISPATYRKRQAYAESHCDELDFDCINSVIWGVSQQIYSEWDKACMTWVMNRPEEQGRKLHRIDCDGEDDPVGSPLDWLHR